MHTIIHLIDHDNGKKRDMAIKHIEETLKALGNTSNIRSECLGIHCYLDDENNEYAHNFEIFLNTTVRFDKLISVLQDIFPEYEMKCAYQDLRQPSPDHETYYNANTVLYARMKDV